LKAPVVTFEAPVGTFEAPVVTCRRPASRVLELRGQRSQRWLLASRARRSCHLSAGHSSQWLLASLVAKEPAAQAMQVAMDSAAGAAEYVPGAQRRQLLALWAICKRPAPHGAHGRAPALS